MKRPFAALLVGALAACSRGSGAERAAAPASAAPSAVAASSGEPPAAPSSAPAPAAGAAPVPPLETFPTTGARELGVAVVHHASLILVYAGQVIWVDPTSEVDTRALPRATFVFLTHDHPDHFDEGAVERARGGYGVPVAPPELARRLRGGVAFPPNRKLQFDHFWAATIPAFNVRRGPSPRERWHPEGSGQGYLFDFDGLKVLVAGDGECTPALRALRGVDVAFLPMSEPTTMSVDEVAACARAFRPKVIYPYHDRGSDPAALVRALDGSGIEVRVRDWY